MSTFTEDQSKIGSKNVVINLDGKTIKENDDMLKSLSEKYNSTGTVFIFTGKKNDFDSARSKRQAAQPKADEVKIFGEKMKDTNNYCFFFTYMGGTVSYSKTQSEKDFFEFDNKDAPVLSNVDCTTKKIKDQTGKDINAYYLNKFDMSLGKDNKKVTLKFSFQNTV